MSPCLTQTVDMRYRANVYAKGAYIIFIGPTCTYTDRFRHTERQADRDTEIQTDTADNSQSR